MKIYRKHSRARTILSAVYWDRRNISALMRVLRQHEDYAVTATSRMSATRTSGTGNHSRVETGIVNMIATEEKIREFVAKMDNDCKTAVSLISDIPNSPLSELYKAILIARHLEYLTFFQMCKRFEYERSQMRQRYDEALEEVDKLIDSGKYHLDKITRED